MKAAPLCGPAAVRKAFADHLGNVLWEVDLDAALGDRPGELPLFMLWCVCLSFMLRETAPPIATSGSPSVVAVSMPVARFPTPWNCR